MSTNSISLTPLSKNLTTKPCQICHSGVDFCTSREVLGDIIVYYRCTECGAIQADFDNKYIITENDGDVNRNQDSINSIRLKRVTSRLTHLKNVLDFGCGNGQFSEFCRKHGYHVDGIDQNTSFQLRDCQNDFYDAIFMTEVLEHLEFPTLYFSKLFDYLKAGGLIYIEGTFADRISNLHVHTYISPEIGHRVINTEKSIKMMLRKDCQLERLSDNVFLIKKEGLC